MMKASLLSSFLAVSAALAPAPVPLQTNEIKDGHNYRTTRWLDCRKLPRSVQTKWPTWWTKDRVAVAQANHDVLVFQKMRKHPEQGSRACTVPSNKPKDLINPDITYTGREFLDEGR